MIRVVCQQRISGRSQRSVVRVISVRGGVDKSSVLHRWWPRSGQHTGRWRGHGHAWRQDQWGAQGRSGRAHLLCRQTGHGGRQHSRFGGHCGYSSPVVFAWMDIYIYAHGEETELAKRSTPINPSCGCELMVITGVSKQRQTTCNSPAEEAFELESLYVPLMIANSISCRFFSSSSPSACCDGYINRALDSVASKAFGINFLSHIFFNTYWH